jgi:predicted Zn-dependent protease
MRSISADLHACARRGCTGNAGGGRGSPEENGRRGDVARRFDDAAGIYRELLSSAPDDPAILVALGAALAQGRHPDQAVAPLEHAVQLNPGLMAAHALLGSSYLALGQYPKAVGSLERVVAARPTDVEHRRMLAEAYGRSERHVDAVNELREVTTLARSSRAAGTSSARRTTRWPPRR